jgi:hypothetical protein
MSQFFRSINEQHVQRAADVIERLTQQELTGEGDKRKRNRRVAQTTSALADGCGLRMTIPQNKRSAWYAWRPPALLSERG